jgi:IPT/TIG domain
MPVYLDTLGNSVLSVAICDRCSRKFPYVDLMPDPNFPGMRVCKDDLDDFDPWRLPAIQTENIALRFPRPDVSVAVDTAQVQTQDYNAMFIEGTPPYSGAQGNLTIGPVAEFGNTYTPPVPPPAPVEGLPPTVLGVNPNVATHNGGTIVTVQGLNFTYAMGVSFGGASVTTMIVLDDRNIVVTTPAHAIGAVDVVVTNPYGLGTGSKAFNYL